MKRPPPPSRNRERFLSLSRHIHRYKRETPNPNRRNERASERSERREREREDLSKLAENLQAKGEVVVDDMAVESKDEGSFTWVINNFEEIQDEKLYSEDFTIGGYKWRLKIYPKGDYTGKGTHVSLYLYVADSDTLPSCWSRSASFTLSVLNRHGPEQSRRLDSERVFYAESTNWGRHQFLSLDELLRGFVSEGYAGEGPRGSIRIEAKIKVRRDKYFSYSLKEAKQFKDRIQDLEKELNEANSKLESANAKLTIGNMERAAERAAAAEKLLEQKLERANERAAAAELKLEDCQMRGTEKIHQWDRITNNLVAQCIKELEGRFEERFECLEKDLKDLFQELKGQPGDGTRNCIEGESDEDKEEGEDMVLVDGVASNGSPSPHS